MSALGPGREFDLIRRFLAQDGAARLPEDVMVGPGDDATVVSAHPLAISTDLSIEGVHFRRDWLEPEEIGWRATMAALSDLAAMAARPVGILLSVAAHDDDADAFAVRVVAGVTDAARSLDARLIGGDVTRSPGPLVLDVVVLGEVSHPLTRDGARAGDEVWVTGRLGAPAMAVRDWLGGARPSAGARARFARPVARTREALWLRANADVTASIDLSDGLAGDLPHVAAASGAALRIERDAIPVHPAAADAPDLALVGGEDYELCLVAPPGALQPVAREFEARFGIPLTRIGVVEDRDAARHVDHAATAAGDQRNPVRLVLPGGTIEPMPTPGYRHFTEES